MGEWVCRVSEQERVLGNLLFTPWCSSDETKPRRVLLVRSVAQSHPTLCDTVGDGHQAALSVGCFQVKILEWVAISSSRASSRPRDQALVPCVSCTAGRFFTMEPRGSPRCALCIRCYSLC